MTAANRALLSVEYVDGTRENFNPNRPALLLAMERKFGVQTPAKHEHVFWLAHTAVGGSVKFADWLDTVESVEPVDSDTPDAEPGK